MSDRGGRRHRSSSTTTRRYPRTARLNELVREIVADELERIDDDRLLMVAVTAVDVAPDLRHARVLYDALDGPERDDEILEAFGELRVRLQAAIGRQARVKRVPELTFVPDPAVREGEHIDAILRTIEPADDADDSPADDVDDEPIDDEPTPDDPAADG
jgi:ribosome-binding factor A